MVDYQFLGMVAVAVAVVSRGSLVPILAVTALVGLVMLAYEATLRRYRRHHPANVAPGPDDIPLPVDADLSPWMAVMDRVLRSHD